MRRTVRLVLALAALAPWQHLRRSRCVEAADSSLSLSRRGIGFALLQVFWFFRHSPIYFASLASKFRTGHLESLDYAWLPTCLQTGRAEGCCRRSVQRVATRAATVDHFPHGPAVKLRAHPGFPRRLVGTG